MNQQPFGADSLSTCVEIGEVSRVFAENLRCRFALQAGQSLGVSISEILRFEALGIPACPRRRVFVAGVETGCTEGLLTSRDAPTHQFPALAAAVRFSG